MEKLPTELYIQILRQLDVSSVCNFSKTKKALYNVSNTDDVWRIVGKKFFKNYNKFMNLKKNSHLSIKTRVNMLGKLPQFCTRCYLKRTTTSRTALSVQQIFRKRWCIKCCRTTLVCLTQAIRLLCDKGIQRRAALNYLSMQSNVKCSMNGTPATFYLLSDLDSR